MTQLPPTHAPESHTTPTPSTPPNQQQQPRPNPTRRFFRGTFTPRTIAAPVAAFTMAIILYTYAVTSIRAAKRNAALHRQADGGQLDMRRESLRRHGALEAVKGTGGVELFRGVSGVEGQGEGEVTKAVRNEGERGGGDREGQGRPRPTEKEARRLGDVPAVEGEKAPRRDRTETEGGLEGWKGREGAERLRHGPPPQAPSGGRILEEGTAGGGPAGAKGR